MMEKILWIHNFDRKRAIIGPFVKLSLESLPANDIIVDEYIFPVFFKNPVTYVKRVFGLYRVAKDYRIIHVQYGGFLVVPVLFLRKKTLILSLRGSDWYRYVHWRQSKKEYVKSFVSTSISKLAINFVDHIVVMSDRMAEEVRSFGISANLTVLPDPMRDGLFVFDEGLVSRRKEAILRGEFRVLLTSISLDNPVKRVKDILHAIDKFNEISGIQVQKIVPLSLEYERMPDFIKDCHVLIMFSTHEGWPNAAKEALSMGIPIITSDVSDLGKLGTPEHAVKVVKNIDDIVDALGYYSKNYTELTYMNWLGDFFSQKRHGNKLLEIYGLYSDH